MSFSVSILGNKEGLLSHLLSPLGHVWLLMVAICPFLPRGAGGSGQSLTCYMEEAAGKRLRGKTVSKSTIREQGNAFMEPVVATVAA